MNKAGKQAGRQAGRQAGSLRSLKIVAQPLKNLRR